MCASPRDAFCEGRGGPTASDLFFTAKGEWNVTVAPIFGAAQFRNSRLSP